MDSAVLVTKGRKEYTLLWFIENYSYCWQNNGEKLKSPEFAPDGLEGTSWHLRLYPRGKTKISNGNVSLYLGRSLTDTGPENFSIIFEISVITANGSYFKSKKYASTMKRGFGNGCECFLNIEEVFSQRVDYLPQDTLTVRCKMWSNAGSIQKVGQYSARTRIGIERICFVHKLNNFSDLKPYEKETLYTRSKSKPEYIISRSLYLIPRHSGTLIVDIKPYDINFILHKLKLYLLDETGDTIECGGGDNRFHATMKDIQTLPLSLTRQALLAKAEYLPNNELSLLCECTFSIGVEFEKIEETQHATSMAACEPIYYNSHNENNNKAAETLHPQTSNDQNEDINSATAKLAACPSAIDDLKAIYDNQVLTDVELKTSTKSFPAHKIVLCARSSVFQAMLTSDMKEKYIDRIQMDDLENDTVQQLLLFFYTDRLENLQWESAINLFYAADKYNVGKLKVLCCSFLVENLSISTAGELLLLADTHSDSEFKKIVEDFILEHDQEVFSSDEWEKLMKMNPLLAMETMRLKYIKKK